MSSQSDSAYARFLEHVTRLCDELYEEERNSSTSRTSYHIQDIALIKNYLPEEIYGDEEHDISALDFGHDDEDLCFDFVGASAEGEAEGME